jgi:DUF4097 and DUF4098 domain-containing protein YvlB
MSSVRRALVVSLAGFVAAVAAQSAAHAMRPPTSWRPTAGGWEAIETSGSSGAHTLPVKGPVKLRVRTLDARVEITPSREREVSVRVTESDVGRVAVEERGGDRVEVVFDGAAVLRCGKACITVPAGSDVEVTTANGDVVITGVEGAVRARTTSGDVHVRRASAVEVRTVSGNITVDDASSDVRIDTVSGDAQLGLVSGAPRVRYASTSGDLTYRGPCGAQCRLEARTMSGDLTLQLAQPSFELHYLTRSGELSDDLHLEVQPQARTGRETRLRARAGRGEGLIDLQTWSGDVTLAAQTTTARR